MKTPARIAPAPAALLAVGVLVLALQACGLLADQDTSPPPPPAPRPAPPVAQAPPPAPTPDWLAEYQRSLDRIVANQPVTIPTPPPQVIQPAPVQPAAVPPAPVQPAPVQPAPVQRPATQPQQQIPPPAPVTLPTPTQTPARPSTAPAQRPAVPQPLAAQPSGFDERSLADLRQQGIARGRLLDDRTAALVARYVEEGIAALDDGDTEEAHRLFGSALQLDPDDAAARDLFDRTGLMLGDRGRALGVVARDARGRAAARSEQQRILVQHRLEQGRQALAADDPAAAQRHFEDALTMIKASADIAPGSALETEAAGLVMQAKAAAMSAGQRRDAELLGRALSLQEQYDHAERERDGLRLAHLRRVANDHFLRNEYADAEEALEEALRIDPDDEQATALWRIANRARHETAEVETRREYQRQWRLTFDELEHDMSPQHELMTFPAAEAWSEIAARGGKSIGGQTGRRSSSDTEIVAELGRLRIPVSFEQVSLQEVVDHLSQVTGVNIVVSPEAQDAGVDNEYNLHDRAEQSVARVLRILLEDLSDPPLTYTVRDGVVQVITVDEARSDYVLEIYDIRDLTVTPSDYTSKDFNLLPSGIDVDSFRDGVEDDEPLPFIGEDALLSLIEENISPDSWSDDPERTIQLLPGQLVVRQTPDVHQQIRDLLDDLRTNTKTLVNIETRFIEVEDSFLEDIGVDLRGLDEVQLEDFGQSGVGFGTVANPFGIGTGNDAGAFYGSSDGDLKGRTENLFDYTLGEPGTLNNAGGLSLQALFLDDTNVAAVLRAVTKYQNSNIVNAPSLTLRSGHRGTIEVVTNRTYVYDFEPEIAQAAVIAQPELRNVKEGIVLDVRAVASSDRRFITLELRPTLAELVRDARGDPLPDQLVSLATGNSADVTIELPELRIQRLRTTATVPDGATMLLGGLKKAVDQDQQSGLPWLSDIPLVGFIFKRQGDYQSRRKLLILLKASLILPEEREPGA